MPIRFTELDMQRAALFGLYEVGCDAADVATFCSLPVNMVLNLFTLFEGTRS